MFTKLINGLLSGLGLRKDKKKVYRTDGNTDFLEAIKKPGTVCLIGGDGFLSNAIQGAEDSFWSHAFGVYVEDTIIEALSEGVCFSPMGKYLDDKNQIVAFQPPVTKLQTRDLLTYAQRQVGRPYGWLEFLEELSPNPSAVKVFDSGRICSAVWALAYASVGWPIANYGIDPHVASPADLWDRLEKDPRVKMFRYNW